MGVQFEATVTGRGAQGPHQLGVGTGFVDVDTQHGAVHRGGVSSHLHQSDGVDHVGAATLEVHTDRGT